MNRGGVDSYESSCIEKTSQFNTFLVKVLSV